MHKDIMNYIHTLKDQFPDFFKEEILEIGSRDTSHRWGTPRQFLNDHSVYVGVDNSPGDNVDIVGLGHEVKIDMKFRAVLCFEVFEHDPYWKKTIENSILHLKDRGIFCWSCASLAREVHGLTDSPVDNYYENRTLGDIFSAIIETARDSGKTIVKLYGSTERDGQDIVGYAIFE